MKLSAIIQKPIITEKTVEDNKKGIYSFRVSISASKGAVKNEINRVFGVDAVDVKTLIVKGKSRRILRTREFSRQSNWKKAIVTLKEGQKIEMFSESK